MKGGNAARGVGRLPIFRDTSRLGVLAFVFVLLSLGDLLVTYALLRRGAGAYEANPVARWVFERWNIAGMASFKFGMIAGVVVLAEVIERKRPGLGKAVMALGCVASAGVMIHGLKL